MRPSTETALILKSHLISETQMGGEGGVLSDGSTTRKESLFSKMLSGSRGMLPLVLAVPDEICAAVRDHSQMFGRAPGGDHVCKRTNKETTAGKSTRTATKLSTHPSPTSVYVARHHRASKSKHKMPPSSSPSNRTAPLLVVSCAMRLCQTLYLTR